MDKFLETYNPSKLSQEEAESLNRARTAGEIEAVIKQLPAHRSPGPDSFTGEFYQTFRGELTLILLKLFKKKKKKGKKKREDSETLFLKPASS